MKREQISYLSKRVKAIAETKRHQLDRQIKYDSFKMEFEEKYALIKSGKAKLKELKDINSYTDLHAAYIYPGEDKFYKDRDQNNSALKKRMEQISKEEQDLLDSINIEEDAKKFLELLVKFENKKF